MAQVKMKTVLGYLQRISGAAETEQLTDKQLLRLFVSQKDQAAFTQLVHRHGQLVMGVCQRVLRHVQDAEDAFQATFLVLSRRASSVRWRDSVANWLYEVAYRIAVEANAKRSRRQALERENKFMPKATPSSEIIPKELCAVLDEELNRLPQSYRQPLLLCYLKSETRDQAARHLGWSLRTLERRLERGRKLLHARLTRRGVTLSAALFLAELSQGAASAGVSPILITATANGAIGMAAGQTLTAAGLSGKAAALAEVILHAMGAGKAESLGILLAAMIITVAGSFALAYQLSTEINRGSPQGQKLAGPEVQKALIKSPKEGFDRQGDPLPTGAVARLGTTRFRHGGGHIHQLLPCPDGKTLISNSYYQNTTRPAIALWDLASGKLLRQLPGPFSYRSIALSPDGKILGIPKNTTIHLWDPMTGKEIRQIKTLKVPNEVYGLAFTADGKILASADSDAGIRLWNTATGKEITQLGPDRRHTLLAFTPDGRKLIAGDYANATIFILDVTARKPIHKLDRGSQVSAIALSPDGVTLAAGGKDGTIPLWNVATGKEMDRLRGAPSNVFAVAISADGKFLAAAGWEKQDKFKISLWDLAKRKLIRQIKKDALVRVSSLAFSTDSKILMTGCQDSVIRLWDVATGTETGPAAGQQGPVNCLALSPDGRTLASAGLRIRLWHAVKGRELASWLDKDRWYTYAISFSPDGQILATGFKTSVALWDVKTRTLLHRLERDSRGAEPEHFQALTFSPDGKTLATASNSPTDPAIRFWDTATGKERNHLTWKMWAIWSVAFSSDGRTLAALGAKVANGPIIVGSWDLATGKELKPLANGAPDPMIRFEYVPHFALFPHGKMLAWHRLAKMIELWEVNSDKRRCLLKGHEGSICAVTVSPDGRTLASASEDQTIRLWDTATGKELRQLVGHRGRPYCLCFSADAKRLFSAGDDTTILVWDVERITRRQRPWKEQLSKGEAEALWVELASADAGKAYQAMNRLVDAPQPAVRALKEHLHPVAAPADPLRVAKLLADLDSSQFQVREKALRKLEDLGESVKGALEQALSRPGSSLEFRRRVEQLLARLPSAKDLQALRAVEVLETIGTPEARQVLQALAGGISDARLTREAQATLSRLAKFPHE